MNYFFRPSLKERKKKTTVMQESSQALKLNVDYITVEKLPINYSSLASYYSLNLFHHW